MFQLTDEDVLPSFGLSDSSVGREKSPVAPPAPVRDVFNPNQLLAALQRAANVRVVPAEEQTDATQNSYDVSLALSYLEPAIKARVLKEFAAANPGAQTLHMFHTLVSADSPVARAVANQIVMETNAKLQETNQVKVLLSYDRKTLSVQRPNGSREPWWDLSGPPEARLLEYAKPETVEYLVNDLIDGLPSHRTIEILGELMSRRNNSSKSGGIFIGEHIARSLVSKANSVLKESGLEHYLAISIEGGKFEVFHVKNNDYNNVTFESYDLKAFAK
ncbi:MAG: hypothetical protein K2W95_06410 [Candidatus Obscuribacterales bacterium]|nr:hypothetical protein [Candidatus Obscuribacterales bacterium]